MKIGSHSLSLPLIQGGMGVGVSLSSLAGNVAKKGAMGVISTAQIGFKKPSFLKDTKKANLEAIDEEIKRAKEISNNNGMVAVNVMVALSDYEQHVRQAVKSGVDAIISGAGLPLKLPEYVDEKTAIAPIVSSGKAARLILNKWKRQYDRTADFIVIEGYKAGGHLGFKKEELLENTCASLKDILKDVKEVVKGFEELFNHAIPVFVAGGIYTNEDIKEMLEAGADGVQMGTRFCVADECVIHDKYKDRILKAKDIDSEVTGRSHGHPVRGLRNKMTREYLKLEAEGASFEQLENLTLGGLRKAVVEGDTDNGSVLAGQIAGMITKRQSCQEIVDEVLDQAERLLKIK